jgi:hypothetical protein
MKSVNFLACLVVLLGMGSSVVMGCSTPAADKTMARPVTGIPEEILFSATDLLSCQFTPSSCRFSLH